MKLTAKAAIVIILSALAQAAAVAARPEVTSPPDSFFDKVTERHRGAARKFYKKYVDIRGMPVVAAGDVAGLALHRTHEIVSHMLAGRPDVLETLKRQGMYLVVIGLAIGIAAALGLSRALSSLLVGIGAADPATYFGTIAVFGAVAFLACALPAWRATRVDPAVTLRYE